MDFWTFLDDKDRYLSLKRHEKDRFWGELYRFESEPGVSFRDFKVRYSEKISWLRVIQKESGLVVVTNKRKLK